MMAESSNSNSNSRSLPQSSWKDALSQLQTLVSNEKHSKAACVASKLLSSSLPEAVESTVEVIRAKCLVQCGRYRELLDLVPDRAEMASIRGYALYRLGQYSACRDLLLRHTANSDVACRHVLAQCCYRLQDRTKALDIYSTLLRQPRDDREEILTNILAVQSRPFSTLEQNIEISEEHNYDLLYNYGTHLLLTATSTRSFSRAHHILLRAERNCTSEHELPPIVANKILANYSYNGDVDEAKRAYISLAVAVAQSNDSGKGVKMVVDNNLTVLQSQKGDASFFDLLKRLPLYEKEKNGASPQQLRVLFYNRALLYLHMSRWGECRQVLTDFQSALSQDTAEKSETILWQAKIALLEHELLQKETNKEASTDAIPAMMSKVQAALAATTTDEEKATLEYALAQLRLYQFQSTAGQPKEAMVDLLEHLPPTIQSRPAVLATLASLCANQEKKILTIFEKAERTMSLKSLADFKMHLGLMEEAATLYKSILSSNNNNNKECKACLVKALSYYDVDQAIKYAAELEEVENACNGEELERMDIPRINTVGKGYVKKLLATHRGIKQGQKKKKNQEAILRQRAKKRERYLQQLEKDGRYNPDRPGKPDPERWIPKTQRSHAKRGRKGRTKFVGAQGGGTGVGADKEAAKLDVAARAATSATSQTKPSTAHLSVSGGGPIGKSGGRRR